MRRTKRLSLIAGALFASLMITFLFLMMVRVMARQIESFPSAQARSIRPRVVTASTNSEDAFVFRFDPDAGSLTAFEVFTLPTSEANPHSLAVFSDVTHLEIWLTEPGVDQIGRLIYTGTKDLAFYEYAVTPGSRPLNLVVDKNGETVWFTEQNGNRIGRFELDGVEAVTYTAFEIHTPSSGPAGIDLAPDGSVWFTEMEADKIGSLTVEDTVAYVIQEYALEDGAAPLPIYTLSDDYVWFGETFKDTLTGTARLRRLWRANGSMSLWNELGGPSSYPYDIEFTGGDFWVTERGSGELRQAVWGTTPFVNAYTIPLDSPTPTGLAVVGDSEFWCALETPGALARMLYTNSSDVHFDIFPLPIPGLLAKDVAVDDQGNVWAVAFEPYRVYLPFVSRDIGLLESTFGVQVYSPISYTHGLSEMVDMGVHWIRTQAFWREVEPVNRTPDEYDWRRWDARVQGAVGEDIELMLTLAGNPSWAAQYAMGPVTDTADLLEFLDAAVERYDGDGIDDAPGSPVVTYWEIYNEPDNADPWYAEHGGYGYFGHNGAGYAALLDAIYPVVKAANPKAQVVFGGVAHDSFEKDGGPFDEEFVEDVLWNCTGDCFDVMNYHYFPLSRLIWEPYGKDIMGKANYFSDVLASYGFERPMICSETTWGATGWGTLELQARYVPIVHIRGIAAGLMMVDWYALTDIDPLLPGLLDNDYQPKLAYYAHKTMAEQLEHVRYRRALTTQELGIEDLEGYIFEALVEGEFERLDVVWYDCPAFRQAPPIDCPGEYQTMTIVADAVKVTDLYGNERLMQDGDDGTLDGNVMLDVTADPFYIDYTP